MNLWEDGPNKMAEAKKIQKLSVFFKTVILSHATTKEY